MANINDKIKVKLTEHGRSIMEKDVTDTLGRLKGFNISDYSPYHTDDKGYTEFQLWNFMRIFGPHFWNGCPQILENNEIIFIPKINQKYALNLLDEWSTYATDNLENHNGEFLPFHTWLAEIKNLSNYEIELIDQWIVCCKE